MNYQDNKKKNTGENTIKRQAGSRAVTVALLAALLCTACGQAEETKQELPSPTPTLAAMVLPGVSGTQHRCSR